MNCPLCGAVEADHWHNRSGRDYWCCRTCRLVFVPKDQHLSSALEKAEYDKHDNDVSDPGYRRFLSRTFEAVTRVVSTNASGLDFGCGPGPALATMLEEAGHRMALYDLYYHPDESVWELRYDFITLTEVIEHLARPDEVLARLWHHLKPGGYLVIQTQRVLNPAAFRQWRYIHDPTHIAFYSAHTFEWMAQWLGGDQVEFPGRDVALVRKPVSTD